MDTDILLILLQDGVVNGAIYALLALSLVLVFAVTRVILIPQGEFVAYGALTYAALGEGRVPGSLWLLCALGLGAFLAGLLALRHTMPLAAFLALVAETILVPALVTGLVLWLGPGKPGVVMSTLLTLAVVTPIAAYLYRIAFQPLAEASVLVLFTGRTRSASEVLAQQSAAMRDADRRVLMRRMVALAFEMKQELESGRLDAVGTLLDENWRLKAQLTTGISDAQIDAWYATGLAHGALGGKLLGAGNGGFMMFFAPADRHEHICAALPGLTRMHFGFERNGAQIAFYQPSE